MTLQGLDLSAAQGELTDIHWRDLAASDIRFVYIECGLGNDAPSATFSSYVAGARAAGIPCGPYNFGYPLMPDPAHLGRDPETQAQMHFEACDGLGTKPGDLPPCLDIEWPEPQDWGKWNITAAYIRDWTTRYRTTANMLWGRPLIIYTYPFFAHSVQFDVSLASARLYIASYQEVPAIPAPWTSYVIQQTSDGGGRLPNGCPVDQNVIRDEPTLASLLA